MKKKHIIIPLTIALVLAILAYLFRPRYGYDIYEYYTWMDKMITFNKTDLINYIFHRGEFIIMGYMYFIALIGNYHLFQFFTTFCFYFIMFYIIFDYAKIKNIATKHLILVFILFCSLLKFVLVVSSRYTLAYSIFCFAIYLEYIKGKKNFLTKFLYIIPIFIHTSGTILLLFRLILLIKEKKMRITCLMVICLITFLPNFLISFLSNFNNPIVDFFNERIIMYLINGDAKLTIQYIFRIIQTILIFTLSIITYKNSIQKINKPYYHIFHAICIFSIFIIGHKTLYLRFVDLILFLFPVILIDYFKLSKNYIKFQKMILYVIFILIICGIRIQIPTFIDMYFKK